MSSRSYADFQRDPDKYLEEVCDSSTPLRITRDNARTVVLVSEDEYDSMVETLLCWRAQRTHRLRASIGNADLGHLSEHETSEIGAG